MLPKSNRASVALVVALLALTGCGGGGGDGDGDANERVIFESRDNQDTREVLDLGLFRTMPTSSAIVPCTLQSGLQTDCHELEFEGAPDAFATPAQVLLCPRETTSTTSPNGFYFLDGSAAQGDADDTNTTGLFTAVGSMYPFFESLGFDIIDEDGNPRIENPSAIANPGQTLFSFCVEGVRQPERRVRVRIPVRPVRTMAATDVAIDGFLGIGLDGVRFAGPVPSTTIGLGPDDPENPAAVAKPVIVDGCGGRVGADGTYRLSFAAETMSLFVSEPACANVPQDATALVGYALDGYPIYGTLDANASEPEDLDECGGHVGTTNQFPDNIYHYHARVPVITSDANGNATVDFGFLERDGGTFPTGLPTCTMGERVTSPAAIEIF